MDDMVSYDKVTEDMVRFIHSDCLTPGSGEGFEKRKTVAQESRSDSVSELENPSLEPGVQPHQFYFLRRA